MNFTGLQTIELRKFVDVRGVFVKTFDEKMFSEFGLETKFREDFYSVSNKDVVRGLHFQTPPADHVKFVYCSRGAVLDVVVDLRNGSPGFGKSFSVELTESNGKALYIPTGFAHGFLALADETTMHYKTSTPHAPANDAGILWSSIDFDWPVKDPIVSERDARFLKLSDYVSPFAFHGATR